MVIAALVGCGSSKTLSIGGHWEIDNVSSGIPEAGRSSENVLYRRSPKVNVRVDGIICNYRFIAPDTVLWISFRNHAMWIATGDHEPLLLQGMIDQWKDVPIGDELDLGALGKHRVADLAALAAKQPPLKSTWKPPQGETPSPTTLPS